jgi:hypothetical protein
MNQTTLTILLPLAGIVVGAILQSFLQIRRERASHKQVLKIKAYTDYLQAAATLSSKDTSKHIDARTLLSDARLRILIYGSSKLVEHIAIFDRTGASLHTMEGMRTFLPVITLMREDNLKDKIKEKDLIRILFGRDTLE